MSDISLRDLTDSPKTLSLALKNFEFTAEQIQKAFWRAVRANNPQAVKILLASGKVDVSAEDKYGDTALMYASENGRTDIVKILLEVDGIDVNAKDNYGDTALMYASGTGRTEIVKILLEVEGTQVNARNKYGETALIYASENKRTEVVEILKKKGAK